MATRATRPSTGVGAEAAGIDAHAEPWVDRTRLLLDLDMTSAPVVMVTAAGGAGKSTLARQWLRDSSRRTATLHVTPHLDDPAALAIALLEVLDPQEPASAAVRSAATSAEPLFSAVLLPALAQLAATPSHPYAVVVDDLHLITDPACHRLLAHVCDAVPAGSQLMLLSRATTPTWLARLRAEGRLAELGPTALAFDEDEAARLFEGRGLALPADQRERILEHTEGWAVGLYLSALALRDGHVSATGAPESVPGGSDRFIADYLASQILDDTEAGVRDFLLRTSILDELTGPLCDALLDRDDSSAVLPALHASNQLVIALDDVGERFRYHHLLSEALRTELTRRDRKGVSALHVRAARWFADYGRREHGDPACEGGWRPAPRGAARPGEHRRVHRHGAPRSPAPATQRAQRAGARLRALARPLGRVARPHDGGLGRPRRLARRGAGARRPGLARPGQQ